MGQGGNVEGCVQNHGGVVASTIKGVTRHALSRSMQPPRGSEMPNTAPRRCQHGIQLHNCKQCGGSAVCEHGNNRYKCKECKAAGKTTFLCEHYVYKYSCAQCGTNKCQHGNNKNICRQCGMTRTRTLCPHGKRKDKTTVRGEPYCRQWREETQSQAHPAEP